MVACSLLLVLLVLLVPAPIAWTMRQGSLRQQEHRARC
jgi:hypothetical protein